MREDGKQEFTTDVIHKSGLESANFEQAMLSTGYGRYNIILLLVCGLVTISQGCQYGLGAYILPSAQCDLNFSTAQMGLLNAAFLIGATSSAIVSSAIADTFGRRKILIWSLLVDGCVTLLSSLSQNFSLLFMCRCINGFAVGGPSTIILIFYGEFHGEKSRTRRVCLLGFFWAVGMVLLPAVAWMVIPLKFNIEIYGFLFNSWRLYLSIFGFPSLLGSFLISKYPESPKFLLSRGKNADALNIMRDIFVSNTKQDVQDYPVKTLVSEYSTSCDESNTLSATLKSMWGQICCLYSPPLRKYTILNGTLLFTNMFGYYGLGGWLPELFNRFEIYHNLHPNVTITVCELAYLRQENYDDTIDAEALQLERSKGSIDFTPEIDSIFSNFTTTQLSTKTNKTIVMCENSVNPKVFINTIIIGFSCVLANLAASYLANHWERRILPVVTMLIAGMCGCLIYFLRTSIQNLIITCLYISFLLMANMTIYSLIIDVFPTKVNAMAIGVSSVFGRLGGILSNILFGWLLDISCEVPIFLVGGIVTFGGLLAFLLPKHPLQLPERNIKHGF